MDPQYVAGPKPVGQLRHSSHTRKGCEGQLQQYLNIKHVQTEQQLWPSTQGLDVATQGQGVNPMAPSHCPDDEEEASQMPLRMLSSMALTQVQPSFMVSQFSQQFGFKPPSQASMRSVPQDHAMLARYMSVHFFCFFQCHVKLYHTIGPLSRNNGLLVPLLLASQSFQWLYCVGVLQHQT